MKGVPARHVMGGEVLGCARHGTVPKIIPEVNENKGEVGVVHFTCDGQEGNKTGLNWVLREFRRREKGRACS